MRHVLGILLLAGLLTDPQLAAAQDSDLSCDQCVDGSYGPWAFLAGLTGLGIAIAGNVHDMVKHENTTTGLVLRGSGTVVYLLGAPLVHLAMGRKGTAEDGFVANLLWPLAGFVAFLIPAAVSGLEKPDGFGAIIMASGILAGGFYATYLNGFVLPYEEDETFM
jgi:hypothetical protein